MCVLVEWNERGGGGRGGRGGGRGGSRKGRGYGELGMVAGGIRRWQMAVVEGGDRRRHAGWAVEGEGGGWGVWGRALTMASGRRWWRIGVDCGGQGWEGSGGVKINSTLLYHSKSLRSDLGSDIRSDLRSELSSILKSVLRLNLRSDLKSDP